MSDLETRPREVVGRSLDPRGPEELLLSAWKVYLGRTTEVARALPDRQIRVIGAWCFLDHYRPEDVSRSPGMAAAEPPRLPGVQLWVARPDHDRDIVPAFSTYPDLGPLARPGVRGQVLVGELDGVSAPAPTPTPLCAADLALGAAATIELALDPAYEYRVFVVAGQIRSGTTMVGVDQLRYLGLGRSTLGLTADRQARVIIHGGEPFDSEIVPWWNGVGRSHSEIVALRQAWPDREPRFPPVVEPGEKVLAAPPLPSVALKPRPHRQAAS